MRYIDSWLTGLGLDYIIPKLKANGLIFQFSFNKILQFNDWICQKE
jgi:hypothetical protein